MSRYIKRTLREAHAAHEALVDNIATLAQVAADDDMPDAYGDHALEGRLDDKTARHFAEQLVARMLYDDDMLIEWMGPEQSHEGLGGRDLAERGDGSDGCLECEDPDDDTLLVAPPTRAEIEAGLRREKLEHAASLRTGEEVVRTNDSKRVKTRGRITGRDMADPTRLHVQWDGKASSTWHYAEALRASFTQPEDYQPDPMQVEADPEPTEEKRR